MADDTVEAARRELIDDINAIAAQDAIDAQGVMESIDALIAAARAEQSKGPAGSFGYCPVCYHPLDGCSNCGPS